MSNKSWHSPGLRLRIDSSRCARALRCLVDLLLGLAALSLGASDNLAPAMLVATVAIVRRCGGRPPPRVLAWRAGAWFLECGGRERPLHLWRARLGLSWMIHAEYRDLAGDESLGLWIFQDCCSRETWRRLRVLLLTCPSGSAG